MRRVAVPHSRGGSGIDAGGGEAEPKNEKELRAEISLEEVRAMKGNFQDTHCGTKNLSKNLQWLGYLAQDFRWLGRLVQDFLPSFRVGARPLTAIWGGIVPLFFSLALAGCGGARADFDEEAYYQRRMAEMREQAAQRREAKQDMLDAYNRRTVTTNTLEIGIEHVIETELLTSGNSAAAAPYPGGPVPAVVLQDARDPYDHVQGKSRTGTRRTQQVIRHADGSTEVITEEEAIYRDRVVPKTEIQAP